MAVLLGERVLIYVSVVLEVKNNLLMVRKELI